MKTKMFIRRYAVPVYFLLTILLTWGGMLLTVYPGRFPLSPEQMEALGPLVYIAMLIGPAGAGILLTTLLDGRAGLRELFSRLFRWKVNPGWYLLAIFGTPLLIVLILSGLSLVSPAFIPALFVSDDPFGLLITALVIGLMVGTFEEVGWTGFAIPRMGGDVLKTGLVVGLIWGLWHFPPFWQNDSFSVGSAFLLLLIQLFSWLPPFRILMVLIFRKTESGLIAILLHAGLTASMYLFVPADLNYSNQLTWILSWAVVLWLMVAAGAIFLRRPAVLPQPEQI